MPMCLLQSRPPFSDWCAQVARQCERLTGEPCKLAPTNKLVRSCYDVGLSVTEMAIELSAA
jgi:hypothetical protein